MAATFFGQYLLIKGIVERDQLREALGRQLRQNKSLGQLAVERGLLSREQSSQINLRQRDTDALFGDMAQSLGWLTGPEIDDLLVAQKNEYTTLGTALIQLGYLSDTKLQHLLADYHYWNTRNQRECNKKVSESSLAPQIEGFSYLLARQLQREFGLRAQPNFVTDRRPSILPEWSWRLVSHSAASVVGVAPAPALLQTLEDRRSLICTTELGTGSGEPGDIHGAGISAEDFFSRLVQQLAEENDNSWLELMDEGHSIAGPAGDSLCVGYSVEGDPLQVYFCGV